MIIGFALIVGAIVAALVMSVSLRFEEANLTAAIKAGVAGVVAGFTFAFATHCPIPLAAVFYVAILAMMGYSVYWWYQEGSTIRELVTLGATDLILMWMGVAAADRFFDTGMPRWLVGVFTGLPKMLMILAIGFFISNRIWFRASLEQMRGGENYDTAKES